MPEFVLNTRRNARRTPHPYYALSDFAKGYVEAMFFTNGDCGDEREWLLNDWGVEALTHEAVADIAKDCETFWAANAASLEAAMALVPGSDEFRYSNIELDHARLGHLFWYARQRHGVSFEDDGDAQCLRDLQNAARSFDEASVEAYRRKIHHR